MKKKNVAVVISACLNPQDEKTKVIIFNHKYLHKGRKEH